MLIDEDRVSIRVHGDEAGRPGCALVRLLLQLDPTGSKPNSYSENDEMTLPNSRLPVSYSTRYYKLQDQDTPSVMPDKLIEPSWETYPLGRDPVMEWILAQPLNK